MTETTQPTETDHVDRFLSGTFAIESKRRLEVGQEPRRNTQLVPQILNVVARDREGTDIRR